MKPAKYIEKYSEFKKVFDPIFKKYGGQPLDERWFDRVQDAHINLRNRISGLTLEADVELKNAQGPASKNGTKPLIDAIDELFPAFNTVLRRYYKTEEPLSELLRWPNMVLDSHRQPKTSKVVLDLYDRASPKKSEESKNTRKKLEKALSDAGLAWARAKTKGGEYRVCLTTEAKAFAQLGHYPVDKDSCFGQGGERDHNKGFLAETEDTFVILIYQNNEIVARFWGFATSEYENFNVCNFYMAKGVAEGNILGALKGFFAAVQTVSPEKIYIHEDLIDSEGGEDDEDIFINDYGLFTFSIHKKLDEEQIIAVNTELPVVNICAQCRAACDEEQEEEMREVDGITVCEICKADSSYCILSRKYTFEDLVTIYNHFGEMGKAKKSEVEKHKEYRPCKCGNYFNDPGHKQCYDCSYGEERDDVVKFYVNV